VDGGMLWRNGRDGKVLRCGAGNRHQHFTRRCAFGVPYVHRWPRSGFGPFPHLTALEEAEIIPGKHPDARIKPLALTNDHGRYMTVTPERTLESAGGCPLNI
jgi:hypothetical protein